MSKRLSWIATLSLLITHFAFAAPAQVVILRHAEKPKNGDDLNQQGYERANALPELFETDPALTRYGAPVAVYAMAPSNDDSSNRAVETVTPLAHSLKLRLQDSFTRNELGAIGEFGDEQLRLRRKDRRDLLGTQNDSFHRSVLWLQRCS